jgi:alpha-ketoglutarate-dependent taurine dioxygenase
MAFQPGDIQLLNNGRILHAREAFEDWEDLSRRRHLIRLWLAAHNFTSVEDKMRAGAGSNS